MGKKHNHGKKNVGVSVKASDLQSLELFTRALLKTDLPEGVGWGFMNEAGLPPEIQKIIDEKKKQESHKQ